MTSTIVPQTSLMGYRTAWQNEVLLSSSQSEGEGAAARVEKSDLQLAEMVLAGDETAFESLFERHKRLVAHVGARYFRQPEQIEEIIQITFTKVYFELKNFRGLHELSLAGWIGKIAANACLDVLRSQKRRPENGLDDLAEIDGAGALFATVECCEQTAVDRDMASKMLARLEPADRALLNMLYAEEMSVAEAAEALGWSRSKTKVRAWRARNTLRKIVEKWLR